MTRTQLLELVSDETKIEQLRVAVETLHKQRKHSRNYDDIIKNATYGQLAFLAGYFWKEVEKT